MNTKKRRQRILTLVSTQEIATQKSLLSALRKEGFEVTQATVSRDLRKMGLTKVASASGRQVYAAPNVSSDSRLFKYDAVFREGALSLDTAGTLLVVHTVSGMAMAVAASLDQMALDQMAGCIAGDDTIFCAMRSAEAAISAAGELRKLLPKAR